jgi:hypothetical protein
MRRSLGGDEDQGAELPTDMRGSRRRAGCVPDRPVNGGILRSLADGLGLWLCRAVLRVDAVPTQKITKSLDLIAQGWEGCPLLQTSGFAAEQLLFPVAKHRRVLEVLGVDGAFLVAADLGDLLVELA